MNNKPHDAHVRNGAALSGAFHIRYVLREDVPKLLAKAPA